MNDIMGGGSLCCEELSCCEEEVRLFSDGIIMLEEGECKKGKLRS